VTCKKTSVGINILSNLSNKEFNDSCKLDLLIIKELGCRPSKWSIWELVKI